MGKTRELSGKDRMLQDWENVLIAIPRANEGEYAIKHHKNDDGEVIGIAGELVLQFEFATPRKQLKNKESALEIAKKEAEEALKDIDKGITSKQKLMVDWLEVRNSIVRAVEGELKSTNHINHAAGGNIVGVTVEWDLKFAEPVPQFFTDEEKEKINEAVDKLTT